MRLFSKLFTKEADTSAPAPSVLYPVAGTLADISTVADQAFASKAMGDGVAIVPTEGAVIAPVSGTVDALFPTGHAFAVATDDGATQVMVHIGIDTVQLGGAGFTAHVAQGERVSAGQPVVTIDIDKISAAGFDPTTFVVVCERAAGTSLREHEDGPVAAGDELLWLS